MADAPEPDNKLNPEVEKQIRAFQWKEGDVVFSGNAKSGSTWVTQAVWLLTNDLEKSAENHYKPILPFLDKHENVNRPGPGGQPREPGLERAAMLKGHMRCMKTHQASDIFTEAFGGPAKFVVTMRNIKDTLVSLYFHFTKAVKRGNYSGTFSEFFELKKEFVFHNWFSKNLSWWEERDRENVLIVKYEDMKRDPRQEVLRLADFLSVSPSEEKLDAILDLLAFDTMKSHMAQWKHPGPQSKETVLMRKGAVGDWKNYFTEKEEEIVDKVLEERLAGTGLSFEYGE